MLGAFPRSDYRNNLCWLFNSSLRNLPKKSVYRPDYLFHEVIGVRESYPYPSESQVSEDLHDGILIRALGNCPILGDIDSSTRGFCAILSRDLVAHERSLSFTYRSPAESWSSLRQMYFGKRRESQISLF